MQSPAGKNEETRRYERENERTREGEEAKGCVRGTCVRMPRPGVLLS